MAKIDIEVGRHSLAHIMAKAVLELYPGTKLAIGPAIDGGFYYDFDMKQALTMDDCGKIEDKMREILLRKETFTRREVSREQALKEFADEPFKVELINDLPEDATISIYDTGDDFKDLCAGPHVESSQDLLSWSYKLYSVASSYWHGDAERESLQRIYAYAFPSKAELKAHMALIEEAKKRDHRKLGPQMDLFFIDDTAPGMPYWLPKGWKLFNALLDFWRVEHEKRGYQEISSPLINFNSLWKTSGHWDHYRDNMFVIPIDENQTFGVKPMNCPNAMVAYAHKRRSYRELPLRFSDCDVLHRREVSGTLHGLLRVQMFRQDDSHNFIREDQIFEEVNNILDIADLFYGVFGMTYRAVMSTRPKDFMGDIELWNKAESAIKQILDTRYGEGGYDINEGDGAFYGPKIDIMMTDALKRVWQTGTIQVDFQLPRNFNLTYTDKDGQMKTPVVLHRVIYGSMERFIGLLIEHFAGAFPYWISPSQVGIVPVMESHNEYGQKILEELRDNGVRVEMNTEDMNMGTKIKEYRLAKLPYVIIVGDEEQSSGTISIRTRSGKQINKISLESFLAAHRKMMKERSLELTEEF